ncbi:hypothetical protein PMAYCL1PPCAC_31400, partial [Pristionchus mayeri]
ALPSDIMRILFRMVDKPTNRLRLISRSWNVFILALRRYAMPILSVHFDPAPPDLKRDLSVRVLFSPGHSREYETLFRGWTASIERDRYLSPTLRLREAPDSILSRFRFHRSIETCSRISVIF